MSDSNKPDLRAGWSPLMRALDWDSIKQLLAEGADPHYYITNEPHHPKHPIFARLLDEEPNLTIRRTVAEHPEMVKQARELAERDYAQTRTWLKDDKIWTKRTPYWNRLLFALVVIWGRIVAHKELAQRERARMRSLLWNQFKLEMTYYDENPEYMSIYGVLARKGRFEDLDLLLKNALLPPRELIRCAIEENEKIIRKIYRGEGYWDKKRDADALREREEWDVRLKEMAGRTGSL